MGKAERRTGAITPSLSHAMARHIITAVYETKIPTSDSTNQPRRLCLVPALNCWETEQPLIYFRCDGTVGKVKPNVLELFLSWFQCWEGLSKQNLQVANNDPKNSLLKYAQNITICQNFCMCSLIYVIYINDSHSSMVLQYAFCIHYYVFEICPSWYLTWPACLACWQWDRPDLAKINWVE